MRVWCEKAVAILPAVATVAFLAYPQVFQLRAILAYVGIILTAALIEKWSGGWQRCSR